MADEKKNTEEQFYSLKEVRELQRKKLRDLHVPENEIEERRKAIISNAKEVLLKLANSIESLATKVSMVECLNADDFAKALSLVKTKLPLKELPDDADDLLNFLTLTREEEMFMVVNKQK